MESVYVFDVDDTLINTTACIRAIDESGNVVFKAGTKVFNAPDSTERLLRPGLYWDFSEFESLEQIMSEPTKPAFEYLRSLPAHSKIYIITARQRADMIQTWLLNNGVELPIDRVHCLDRTYAGSVAQWKGEVIKGIIRSHPYHKMVIFEDDLNNINAMSETCKLNDVPVTIMPV